MGLTLLAIGDSITDATGATTRTKGYIYQVSKQLKANGKPHLLVNSSIGGYRSDQLLKSYKLKGGKCDADLIIIMCGTNDLSQGVSSSVYQSNLEAIIDDLRVNKVAGKCEIVLCAILWANDTFNVNIPTFNGVINQVGTSKGCTVVDTYTSFADATYLSDTVHPNDAGHLAVANILTPALNDLSIWSEMPTR